MENASRYGIGCGTLLLLAGVVELLGLTFGWGIPELIREKQPAKNGMTGSARPLGLPASQPFQSYEPGKLESYLNSVEKNMISNGFQLVQFSQDTRAFYKKDFGRSSEFYFILGRVNGMLMPEKVQAISQRTFEHVGKNK